MPSKILRAESPKIRGDRRTIGPYKARSKYTDGDIEGPELLVLRYEAYRALRNKIAFSVDLADSIVAFL